MTKKGYGATLVFLATIFPTGGCAPSGDVTSSGPYDVIITNARIIDGTGNPWFRGDVGIRGKRIVTIGDLSGDDANEPSTPGGILLLLGLSIFTVMLPGLFLWTRVPPVP